MSLGYSGEEGLAWQIGAKIGQGMAESGVSRFWSPLEVWRESVSESIDWEEDGRRKTLEALGPLWVRLPATPHSQVRLPSLEVDPHHRRFRYTGSTTGPAQVQ